MLCWLLACNDPSHWSTYYTNSCFLYLQNRMLWQADLVVKGRNHVGNHINYYNCHWGCERQKFCLEAESYNPQNQTTQPNFWSPEWWHKLTCWKRFISEPHNAGIQLWNNMQSQRVLLTLIHICHGKERLTATLVKTHHLQHSHALTWPSLIWLANLQRHKIRYLHTRQLAFFKTSCYASHSVYSITLSLLQ